MEEKGLPISIDIYEKQMHNGSCVNSTRLVDITGLLVLGILRQCEGKFTEKSKEQLTFNLNVGLLSTNSNATMLSRYIIKFKTYIPFIPNITFITASFRL